MFRESTTQFMFSFFTWMWKKSTELSYFHVDTKVRKWTTTQLMKYILMYKESILKH